MMATDHYGNSTAQPARRILITDSKRWAVGVRIGLVFAQQGCEVGMLCPAEGHPAFTVGAIRHRFVYRGAAPVASLRRAIETFRPDLILATCDRGVHHLHRLHAEAQSKGEDWLVSCIESSIGPAASYPIVSNRYALLKLAREEGILIPDTLALEKPEDVEKAAGLGFPLVIKADGTWGGGGVLVPRTLEAAQNAFESLNRRKSISWLARQLLLNRDRGTIFDDWKHAQPSLIAQAWVNGRPANCAVACKDGKVLAGIAVEVVASNGERGPASVVEVVEGREILRAAEKIAQRLDLSGFFGLDFMISRDTGAAYLIEMNPRSTQPCSLELGTGRNLPVAMCAAMAGVEEPETDPVTRLKQIAYFPKQGLEDSAIPKWSYYYDVPTSEPGLIEQLLHQWPDRGVLGRMVDRMRGVARGRYTPASYVATPTGRAAGEPARMVRDGLRTGTR